MLLTRDIITLRITSRDNYLDVGGIIDSTYRWMYTFKNWIEIEMTTMNVPIDIYIIIIATQLIYFIWNLFFDRALQNSIHSLSAEYTTISISKFIK